MGILKSKELSFQKIMLSMGIIMLVWSIFWYPFDYFVFSEDFKYRLSDFISFSREYIRMLPAIIFIIYYSKEINLNFKDLFSFKFNYKIFSLITILVILYFIVASYFKNGKVYFDWEYMQFRDIAYWFSLGLCQELVFRGWGYNSFKSVVSQKNAIILSSFFFAASHWFAHFFRFYTGTFSLTSFTQVTIFTFIFGVGMCFILIKTKNKSIIPLIILHSLWDFLATAI